MFTFEGGHKTKSPKINISLLFGVFHELAFLKDSFQNQDLRLNFLMLEPTQKKLASIFLLFLIIHNEIHNQTFCTYLHLVISMQERVP